MISLQLIPLGWKGIQFLSESNTNIYIIYARILKRNLQDQGTKRYKFRYYSFSIHPDTRHHHHDADLVVDIT